MTLFNTVSWLFFLLSLSGVWQSSAQSNPKINPDEIRVTLLGTGSPNPVMNRFGPSVLIQAGGKNLLVDSGRGVTQRIVQSGLKLGDIHAVFLTH